MYDEDDNIKLTEEGIRYQQQLNTEIATETAERETAAKLNEESLGKTSEQLKLDLARSRLAKIENGDAKSTLDMYNQKIEAQKVLAADLQSDVDQKLNRLLTNDLKSLYDQGTLTKEQLESYTKALRGSADVSEEERQAAIDWYNKLEPYQKDIFDRGMEGIEETRDELDDLYKTIAEDGKAVYEAQIDTQNQMLDSYKAKLEAEQDSLQNSLDKRKEMYEKYFDSLEEEESDESFEEEQARLQRAIASLSTSTDATSLQKLKEYQQELADLEDEQRSTERERRRDSVMDAMDNQSEAVDQYYEDRLANEQALWEEIEAMSSEEISSLMTTYNEDFTNATDLNKEYLLLSYKQLQADLLEMTKPDSEEALAARADADNYENFITAKSQGLVSGVYDSTANYQDTIDQDIATQQESNHQDEYNTEKKGLEATDPLKNESYEEWKKRKGYSQGGIVDYTGTAMVHGSPSKPEAFLNASQTALFSRLATNLDAFYTRSSAIAGGEDSGNNVVIENFTIAIDAELTDNNLNQTGQNLADALFEGLRRTGVSVNMKK